MDQFNPQALAQGNTYGQAFKDRLAELLGSNSMGNGMAQNAAAAMQNRPYQLHTQEAQAMGQQPMSLEQFIQMSRQQQPARRGLLD